MCFVSDQSIQLVEADNDICVSDTECHSDDDDDDDDVSINADYSFANDLPANADMFFAYATTEGTISPLAIC